MRMPRERLGVLAMDILEQMLSGKAVRGIEVVVETELVIRESTGPAPGVGNPPRTAQGQPPAAR